MVSVEEHVEGEVNSLLLNDHSLNIRIFPSVLFKRSFFKGVLIFRVSLLPILLVMWLTSTKAPTSRIFIIFLRLTSGKTHTISILLAR